MRKSQPMVMRTDWATAGQICSSLPAMIYTSCLRILHVSPQELQRAPGETRLTNKVDVVAVPAHIRPHNQRNESREEEHEAAAEHVGAVGGGNEAPC